MLNFIFGSCLQSTILYYYYIKFHNVLKCLIPSAIILIYFYAVSDGLFNVGTCSQIKTIF